MDALWFGCIPVLIADYFVPPLLDLIQWDSIAVSIAERQVSDLKRILLSIPEQKIQDMQLNIQKVWASKYTVIYHLVIGVKSSWLWGRLVSILASARSHPVVLSKAQI